MTLRRRIFIEARYLVVLPRAVQIVIGFPRFLMNIGGELIVRSHALHREAKTIINR